MQKKEPRERFERVFAEDPAGPREKGPPKKRVRAKKPPSADVDWEARVRSTHDFPCTFPHNPLESRYAVKGKAQLFLDAALHQAAISGLSQGVQHLEMLATVLNFHTQELGLTTAQRRKLNKVTQKYIREVKEKYGRGDFAL